MLRRNFLKTTGLLTAGSMISPDLKAFLDSKNYKLGYQLYSIRDEMAKEPVATLKALKAMGYQDFETYGYDAEADSFYGFKSKAFKKVLDDLGLTTNLANQVPLKSYMDTTVLPLLV